MIMFKTIYLWWKDRRFRHLRNKSPEKIFTDVYERNAWGGAPGTFYSGSGTVHPNTAIYIQKVRQFIRERSIGSIVEIGCGDFRVTSQVLNGLNVIYTGTDVVQPLIDRNNKEFGGRSVTFAKINAIDDVLPPADLILIRQVLQHLNNDQIAKILSKVSTFKYALITEHLPVSHDAACNLDKTTGPHIRIRINSGVFIDQPPFSMKGASVYFEYREDDPVKGRVVPAVMRTYLVEN
jgi:hypothetical protein